jgi:Chaperone of endosialidase
MFEPIHRKTATLPLPSSISRAPLQCGFLLIPLALACFALPQTAQAQDGDELRNNTAEGLNALHTYLINATSAANNTAIGTNTLFSDTTGNDNTATGVAALGNNTTGLNNTATGVIALGLNTTGNNNTAAGYQALDGNTTGNNNTANGVGALGNNNADNNTATGFDALFSNRSGFQNTATGYGALFKNASGNDNTVDGAGALGVNTTGNDNTASGFDALARNTTGSSNIALGFFAGSNLTTGSNNIDIGAFGVAGEAAKIRIGKQGTQNGTFIAGIYGATLPGGVPVVVGSGGKLGVATSSARFKEAIKPMDKASETILQLQPVTFRYKQELDPDAIPQFGLIAEQVEKVNPDLVVRDADGKVNTVRYEAVNAMLLNEFLKEHSQVQELKLTVTQQQAEFQAKIAQQQKQIEALMAGLQKVSAQIEVNKSAPQTVGIN